jgi:transposase
MKIIGCDFHPSYQQIAMLDLVTGEMVEKALSHERKEEVRAFYAGLEGSVRVGIEASGQSQWFERMLVELGHEVWIGDAAKIRASCERKQKTDRRDADLLLRLLAENRFPRIWMPTAVERDDRQLLLHRHKLVRIRTQVKNQLQALALNQGCATEVEAVEQGGKKAAGVAAAAALGEPAESGVAAAARSPGGVDRRVGPCGGRAGFGAAGGTAIDDASRRGTGHGTSLHADDGAG